MIRQDVQQAVRAAIWLRDNPQVAAKVSDPKAGVSAPVLLPAYDEVKSAIQVG